MEPAPLGISQTRLAAVVCHVLRAGAGGLGQEPAGVPTRPEGRPRAPQVGARLRHRGARGGRPTVPAFQTLPRAPPPARCPGPRGAGSTGRERAPGRRRLPIGCRPRARRIGAACPAPLPGARGMRPAPLLGARHIRPQRTPGLLRGSRPFIGFCTRPSRPKPRSLNMSGGRRRRTAVIGCGGPGGRLGGWGSRRPLCVGTSRRPRSREAAAAILCVPVFAPTPARLSGGAAAPGTPRLCSLSGEAERRPRAAPREPPPAAAAAVRSRCSQGEEAARRSKGGKNLWRCPRTGGGVSAPGPGAAPAVAWRTRSCASCSSAG